MCVKYFEFAEMSQFAGANNHSPLQHTQSFFSQPCENQYSVQSEHAPALQTAQKNEKKRMHAVHPYILSYVFKYIVGTHRVRPENTNQHSATVRSTKYKLVSYGQKSIKIESNYSNRIFWLICCYLFDFSQSD